MTQQLILFDSSTKSQKLLQNISPDDCIISRFNTRKTRPRENAERLAERIKENGFELTRAPWAYRNGDNALEVFAGGTRLEAARLAEVLIPVVLFEGYTDEEIARLTDQDNENDEYHAAVSPVDIWAEYARLRDEEGWTQEKIAGAKGIDRSLVSKRQGLHDLPDRIKEYVNQNLLTERHLIEISSVCTGSHFSPWLTSEQAWEELAENSRGLPVRICKEKVEKLKKVIELAEKIFLSFQESMTLYDLSTDEPQPFSYNEKAEFIDGLARRQARTQVKVNEAKREVELFVAKNLENCKIWISEKEAEAARRAIRAKQEEELLSAVHLGDFRETMESLPDNSVDLIFTDPPYDEEHIPDYGDLAKIAARVLKPNGSLIVYAGHYALPQIFELMCPYLTYWWQLIVKHSSGNARQPGKWVFVEYKPLLWFVKGGRRDNRYVSDLIHSDDPGKEHHEWEQSLKEALYCIEQLTDEGDLVVDPFCGSGTTTIAALELKRNFWTCDISDESLDVAKGRLLEWIASHPDTSLMHS